MNIPIVHIAGEDRNDPDRKRDYLFQVGLISSALEHAVPERMFTNEQNPGEAISAVKALQKANAQGQRIYHITPDNRGGTLSQIHHTPFVMEEIRNALNAGKEVITHTDAVSVPGWTGAGYILFDPHTGDGAFKIGGGMNGGGKFDPIFALSLSLATLGGTADAYSAELANNNLPLSEELAKYRLAQIIHKAAQFLGSAALLVDIYSVISDASLSITNKVGRLSIALFSFGVGTVVGGALAATFTPIAAAIVASVFVATLTIILTDFSLIYFSFYLRKRSSWEILGWA